jgi:hypothetical protein
MLIAFSGTMAALLLQASTAPTTGDTTQSPDPSTAVAADQNEPPAIADGASQQAPITDRSHPDYVRCRSQRVIGSLAKRTKTCMTNREWETASRVGNRGARDIVESQQVGINAQ